MDKVKTEKLEPSIEEIDLYLKQAQSTLCQNIELSALYERNPTAHKWKLTFRCLVIRELVAWRFFDLLKQAIELQRLEHILGTRILLRCAIETLALLIHNNQKIENIIKTGDGFHEFSETTAKLLLGSKNKTTNIESINIRTILKSCNKRYDGILDIYGDLSESAHPNWQGVMLGYAQNNYDDYEVTFKNRWVEIFENSSISSMDLFLKIFETEYNEIWPQNFKNFEKWIEENNTKLEKSKKS